MISPAISLEEAQRWKAWLAEFGIDLMTTVIDNKVYPVDLRMLPGRTSPL